MATATREARVLERFAESPAGQALLDAQAAELVEERKGQAAEVAQLRADHLAELPRLTVSVEREKGKVEKAQKALETAREGYRVAYLAEAEARSSTDAKVGRLEGSLRETANPLIGEFVREMSRESDATRCSGSTDYPAINRRIVAITAAREEAELLTLEALTEDQVHERIEALARALPAVT